VQFGRGQITKEMDGKGKRGGREDNFSVLPNIPQQTSQQ
jgi:hypothetical protein